MAFEWDTLFNITPKAESTYDEFEKNYKNNSLQNDSYEEDKKRGQVDRLLDLLQVGNYATAGMFYNLTDKNPETSGLEGIVEGIESGNPFGQGKPEFEKTYSDVLTNLSWKPETGFGKVAKGVTGFALDVGLDPLTYVNPFSAAAKVVKGTGKVVKGVPNLNELSVEDAEKVIKEFYKGKNVDITKVEPAIYQKEVADLQNSFNSKILKIKNGGEDFQIGMKNVPFTSKVKVGDKTLASFNRVIASSDTLRSVGDKTIAPYFNAALNKIRDTKVAKKFNINADLTEMAKKDPLQAAMRYKMSRGIKGFDLKNIQKDYSAFKFVNQFDEDISTWTPEEVRAFSDFYDTGGYAAWIKNERKKANAFDTVRGNKDMTAKVDEFDKQVQEAIKNKDFTKGHAEMSKLMFRYIHNKKFASNFDSIKSKLANSISERLDTYKSEVDNAIIDEDYLDKMIDAGDFDNEIRAFLLKNNMISEDTFNKNVVSNLETKRLSRAEKIAMLSPEEKKLVEEAAKLQKANDNISVLSNELADAKSSLKILESSKKVNTKPVQNRIAEIKTEINDIEIKIGEERKIVNQKLYDTDFDEKLRIIDEKIFDEDELVSSDVRKNVVGKNKKLEDKNDYEQVQTLLYDNDSSYREGWDIREGMNIEQASRALPVEEFRSMFKSGGEHKDVINRMFSKGQKLKPNRELQQSWNEMLEGFDINSAKMLEGDNGIAIREDLNRLFYNNEQVLDDEIADTFILEMLKAIDTNDIDSLSDLVEEALLGKAFRTSSSKLLRKEARRRAAVVMNNTMQTTKIADVSKVSEDVPYVSTIDPNVKSFRISDDVAFINTKDADGYIVPIHRMPDVAKKYLMVKSNFIEHYEIELKSKGLELKRLQGLEVDENKIKRLEEQMEELRNELKEIKIIKENMPETFNMLAAHAKSLGFSSNKNGIASVMKVNPEIYSEYKKLSNQFVDKIYNHVHHTQRNMFFDDSRIGYNKNRDSWFAEMEELRAADVGAKNNDDWIAKRKESAINRKNSAIILKDSKNERNNIELWTKYMDSLDNDMESIQQTLSTLEEKLYSTKQKLNKTDKKLDYVKWKKSDESVKRLEKQIEEQKNKIKSIEAIKKDIPKPLDSAQKEALADYNKRNNMPTLDKYFTRLEIKVDKDTGEEYFELFREPKKELNTTKKDKSQKTNLYRQSSANKYVNVTKLIKDTRGYESSSLIADLNLADPYERYTAMSEDYTALLDDFKYSEEVMRDIIADKNWRDIPYPEHSKFYKVFGHNGILNNKVYAIPKLPDGSIDYDAMKEFADKHYGYFVGKLKGMSLDEIENMKSVYAGADEDTAEAAAYEFLDMFISRRKKGSWEYLEKTRKIEEPVESITETILPEQELDVIKAYYAYNGLPDSAKYMDDVVKSFDDTEPVADEVVEAVSEATAGKDIGKVPEKFIRMAETISEHLHELGIMENRAGFLSTSKLISNHAKYLPHILSDEARVWAIKNLAKDSPSGGFNPQTFATGYRETFNKSHKYNINGVEVDDEGMSLLEANDKMKELTGVDNWFETDLVKILQARTLASNNLLYNAEMTNAVKKLVGKPYDAGQKIEGYTPVISFIDMNGALNSKFGGIIPDEVFERLDINKNLFTPNNAYVPLRDEQIAELENILTDKTLGVRESVYVPMPWNLDDTMLVRLNRESSIQKHMQQSMLMNLYDRFLIMYKMSNTVFMPGFHTQNAVSNAFSSFLSNGSSVLSPKKYQEAYKIYNGKNAKDTIKIGDETITYEQLRYIAEKYGILSNTFFKSDIRFTGDEDGLLKKFGVSGKYDPTDLNKFVLYQEGAKVGSHIEGTQRLVLFIDNLRNGKSIEEAVENVDKFLFDYSDLTDFEKDVMKRIIPFYTFMRKNVPLQLEQMLNNPQKFMLLEKGFNNFEAMSEDEVEETERNEWTQQHVQMPFKVNGRNIGVNPQLPYQQLDKLTLAKLLGQSTPAIKGPIELTSGEYAYTGMDIESPVDYMLNQTSPTKIVNQSGDKEGFAKKMYLLSQLSGFPVNEL